MMARAAVDPSRPFLRARSTARRALLDAARRIAEREGVEAVSLGSVADEVGFARATAYANFCSRDELLQAVVADDLSILLRAMRSAMGIPEPPSHPPPPTRVVRVEFQRTRDECFDSELASDKHDHTADEAMADVDVLPLKLFRDACNDRFEAEPDVHSEFNGTPLHPHAGQIDASVARLEKKLGLLEQSLTVLDERVSIGNPSGKSLDLSQRLAALEQKHERTLREMMSEIRTLAEKFTDRPVTDRAPDPQSERDEVDASFEEPLLLSSPLISESDAAPGSEQETKAPAETSERQLGWTIRFSTNNSVAAKATSVKTPSRLPIQMVVAQPQSSGHTRHIIIGLLAGVLLLGVTAIALRMHNSHVAPAALNSTLRTAQALRPRISAARVVRSEAPVDRLSMQAESGEPDAELAIGLKYLNGDGATKNEAVGAGWIARSALKGNTLAQYWLATLYEHGRGVVVDPVQAFAWYEKAALGGNKKAMHNLAVAYAQGSGVGKDMSEAARWFSRAASLGYVDSAFNLAVLYERGDGVPQSLLDAYKWYAIAAAQGDAESKLRLSAIQSELSPEAVAAADKAAGAFKIDASATNNVAGRNASATP